LIETPGPLHPPGHLIFRERDTLLQYIVPIAAIAFKNGELPIVGQDNPLRPPAVQMPTQSQYMGMFHASITLAEAQRGMIGGLTFKAVLTVVCNRLLNRSSACAVNMPSSGMAIKILLIPFTGRRDRIAMEHAADLSDLYRTELSKWYCRHDEEFLRSISRPV
jgi:hypothetical protein